MIYFYAETIYFPIPMQHAPGYLLTVPLITDLIYHIRIYLTLICLTVYKDSESKP